MRLSISAKIFLGFVVVLLSFGGAASYGAWAVHTMGEQLRLVALGYSFLRLDLQDQLTMQANLQKRLSDSLGSPRLGKEITADCRRRELRLSGARRRVQELRPSVPKADARFLDDVSRRLGEVSGLYAQSAPLFDELYGQGSASDQRRDELLAALQHHEEQAEGLLQDLSTKVSEKVSNVAFDGQRYETRMVLMTLLLSTLASGVGLLVMLLVQATLRPLRRLSDSAKEVARGNYSQRVASDSPDEVGALGREFNAMAAALEEREQRLRRSEQLAAVGKMAAQITHEVRNPLSSIGLNAELLADEVAGTGTEAQTLAQAIVKEVDRLAGITEGYLRFARPPEPRFEREDVTEVVRGLLQFMAEEMAGHGISVQADLAPGLPPVQLDENQLRPALLNLLRNAREAMAGLVRERRLLIVRTREEHREGKRWVRIDIIDRGPGIPLSQRGRIFEPFFTTKKGGTGLGLALAHEVVIKHGGALLSSSPAEGGTHFTVELPAEESPG